MCGYGGWALDTSSRALGPRCCAGAARPGSLGQQAASSVAVFGGGGQKVEAWETGAEVGFVVSCGDHLQLVADNRLTDRDIRQL
jgi:hypothetical protein